jgi:hypothetical protein
MPKTVTLAYLITLYECCGMRVNINDGVITGVEWEEWR